MTVICKNLMQTHPDRFVWYDITRIGSKHDRANNILWSGMYDLLVDYAAIFIDEFLVGVGGVLLM